MSNQNLGGIIYDGIKNAIFKDTDDEDDNPNRKGNCALKILIN